MKTLPGILFLVSLRDLLGDKISGEDGADTLSPDKAIHSPT